MQLRLQSVVLDAPGALPAAQEESTSPNAGSAAVAHALRELAEEPIAPLYMPGMAPVPAPTPVPQRRDLVRARPCSTLHVSRCIRAGPHGSKPRNMVP